MFGRFWKNRNKKNVPNVKMNVARTKQKKNTTNKQKNGDENLANEKKIY